MILAPLITLAAVLLCIAAVFFALDRRCSADIARWLPLYPNAQLVEEQYNAFRPRSVGTTLTVMKSPDDPDTVRRWYSRQRAKEDAIDPSRGLATANVSVSENPDGPGSMIYLYSQCAQ